MGGKLGTIGQFSRLGVEAEGAWGRSGAEHILQEAF